MESYGSKNMFHHNHGHVKRLATALWGECENHHDNIVCPVCFVDISLPHGLIPRFKAAAHCKSAANAMCTACALMLVLATVLSVKKNQLPAPLKHALL